MKGTAISSLPGPAPGSNSPVLPGSHIPAIRLLGVRIDCLHLPDLLQTIGASIQRARRLTIMYVNVHTMNLQADDAEYSAILKAADIVYCDGTGVRLGARIARRSIPERMTGADWIDDLCVVAADRSLSLFFLGGAPHVAERAARILTERYPNLRILGTAPGFGLDEQAIRDLNHLSPDIVLVGMGSPTQEKWIARHREEIDAPVVWAVGALFDFVSGRIPRGPALLTEHGFEWACRLVVEPRKLWRRYLIGNPRFIARVLRERYERP